MVTARRRYRRRFRGLVFGGFGIAQSARRQRDLDVARAGEECEGRPEQPRHAVGPTVFALSRVEPIAQMRVNRAPMISVTLSHYT
jgi:hypothetical protein